MTQSNGQPTTFLSLSRELRQKILDLSITFEQIDLDACFSTSLEKLDNNILAVILSHTSGLRTYSLDAPKPNTDMQTLASFRTAYHQLRERGIIPVDITNHAEKLVSVHPIVKKDMGWVLPKWFKEFYASVAEYSRATPPRTRHHRQSIYVSKPFGGYRRFDKFTGMERSLERQSRLD